MTTEFNLWRNYPVPPYRRWACKIVEDENLNAGFRVISSDGRVADAAFLHALMEHLKNPHPVGVARPLASNPQAHADGIVMRNPGEDGHFAEAVRTFEGAFVGPERS